jgi:hypothetical protein
MLAWYFFKFFMVLCATKSACSEDRSFFAREDVSHQGSSGNVLVEILYGDGVGAGEDGPCRGTSSMPRAISLTFDVLWGLAGNIDEWLMSASRGLRDHDQRR